MFKTKYWYAILPAALLLGLPLSSAAKLATNGTSLNGISLNGTLLISLISPNGTALQSFTSTNQGVLRAEKGRLVIQTSATAP